MADNKEKKTVDIDVNIAEEPVELGYQGKATKSQDASAEELKQQAGELIKAAGGFAGSLGKFAAKKGGELKEKISDEEFQEKVKSGAKAYAEKAGTVVASGATKAEDAIKESTAAAKAKAAKKSEQLEAARRSSNNSGKSGSKTIGIIILAVCVVVAGIMAVLLGGNDEQPATEEPVAEESTKETSTSEEQTIDSESSQEAGTVYYSTNTEDTVKDGNKGVYSYKNQSD